MNYQDRTRAKEIYLLGIALKEEPNKTGQTA